MIAVTIEGTADLRGTLDRMSRAIKKRMAKEAVTAAAVPVMRAMEQHALKSKDTGALHQSIGVRSVVYRSGNATAIVGPRRGTWGGTMQQPARYAHLVEFGHAASNGKYVPGKPFMRPAWDETKGSGTAIIAQYLTYRIEQAAKREAKRAAKRARLGT
jgi:HK97 gp10 family phage protein